MKLKKRILSGALALAMVAGSFFINSGQASAATDPTGAPADWAFEESSIPLHDAILATYPTIDANSDGYISVSEANNTTATYISLLNQGIKGHLNGIEHFSKLTYLYLQNNEISGNIPSGIGGSETLTIHLSNNKLTGEIPSSIDSLSKLQYLNLNDNNLTGEIPSSLGNILTLEKLLLSNNNFEGKIPASFQNLNLVTNFQISGNGIELNGVEGEDDVLVDDVTQEKIDLASTDLENFPPNESSISTWQAKINHAQSLLDLRTDAEDQVEALFTTAGDALNTGITQSEIDNAQTAVDLLPDGSTVKADLQAKIDLAQQMLDTTVQVDALLTSDGANRATGTTQADIDAAQTAVTALPDGTLKTELQAKIDTAQSLLDAEGLVGDLFTDDTKTDLASGVTQGAIDAAQTAVTALPDGATKTNLQADIDLAQSLLDAKTLADAKTAAKAELDQKAADANNAIDALPNLTEDEKTAEKNKVNTDLNDAKTAIDAETDTTAVNDAKNSGDTHITNDLNDAKALDAANLADAKTAAKAELVAKADAVKNAIDGLTSLSDAEKAAAKATVDAELTRGSDAIDAATTIPKVTEEKTTSIANMDKILKDAKVLDAKNAVANLFDDEGKIKDTVNQDVINSAKEKANGLEPGAEKDLLNMLIVEAQKQLDAKNAVESTPVKPIYSGAPAKTFDNISTGDHSNSILYIVGMFLALLGLGVMVRRKMMKQS